MKFNRVLIYLLIFVALVSYVYIVEIRQKREKVALEQKAAKLVDIEQDKVDQLKIRSKKHGENELKKVDGNWVLVNPIKYKTDDQHISSLIRSASGAEREQLLLEKDVKWSEYGFDDPVLTIEIGAGEKQTRILFGSLNPAKTSYYARVDNNPQLLLVADTLKNSLDKSTLDLRDKTVVAIAPEDVDTVTFSESGKELELKKEVAGKWTMLKPEKMRVKTSVVDQNLRRLTTMRAKDIIDKPEPEGDPYGLKEPETTIVLSGPKLGQTLLVGKAVEKKEHAPTTSQQIYAQVKGRDIVFVVDQSPVKKFATDPESLRDRSLFAFDPEKIEKVEIEFEGKKWVASQEKDKKWKLEMPTKKDQVDTWLVTSVLWDIKDLEWKELKKPTPKDLSSLHLDKPVLAASLFVKGEKDPIVFKAGWKQETKAKSEKNKESTTKAPTPPDQAKKPSKGEKQVLTEEKSSSDATPRSPTPDTVFATVAPHEEKEAVFLMNGNFISRLKADLQRLSEEKK